MYIRKEFKLNLSLTDCKLLNSQTIISTFSCTHVTSHLPLVFVYFRVSPDFETDIFRHMN